MDIMKLLGESLQLNESLVAVIEKFVCHIYRMSGEVDINEVRYKMFGRDKTPDANQLPATRDELLQHIKRSNYQSYIWKNALLTQLQMSVPQEHGKREIDGKLEIV